jgi:hypothetical protein
MKELEHDMVEEKETTKRDKEGSDSAGNSDKTSGY